MVEYREYIVEIVIVSIALFAGIIALIGYFAQKADMKRIKEEPNNDQPVILMDYADGTKFYICFSEKQRDALHPAEGDYARVPREWLSGSDEYIYTNGSWVQITEVCEVHGRCTCGRR